MNELMHFDPEAGYSERRGNVTWHHVAPACGAPVGFQRIGDGRSEPWPPCTRNVRQVTCQRCKETAKYQAATEAEPAERRGKILGGVVFPPRRMAPDPTPSEEQ